MDPVFAALSSLALLSASKTIPLFLDAFQIPFILGSVTIFSEMFSPAAGAAFSTT